MSDSPGREITITSAPSLTQAYLMIEFTALFVVLPSLYMYFRPLLIHPIPAVWGFAALSGWLLSRHGAFSREALAGTHPGRKKILAIVVRFLVIAAVLWLAVVVFEPQRLFAFPRRSPTSWLLFVVLYPILSAVPQGIVFRVFFFQRYQSLFGDGWLMIAASAVTFSYAHIIYRNPVAIVLTLAGGLMFAHTYAKSNSLWISSMEHALYGDFIFTIGLGYYIYSGAVMH